jgi:hypothetical protein
MGNRNRFAHRIKPAPVSHWPLSIGIMVLGASFAMLGLHAFRAHIWWVATFNPRLGTVGYGPTIGGFFFGLLLVLLGILSFFRAG